MKILAISLGLLLVSIDTTEKEVNEVVRGYIQWTTTGKSEGVLFSEDIILTYSGSDGDENVLFQEYKNKIEIAASSIPREMSIKSVDVIGDMAKAVIGDCSEEYFFSLVHHLILKNTDNRWKIESIKIEVKI